MNTSDKEKILAACWPVYKQLGETAFPCSHYDLAKITSIDDPEIWKVFLMDAGVSEWIQEELNMLQGAELNKMLANVSKSRSVGQAQIINALSKLKDGATQKEGPVFIYMYVPLNEEQAEAPNVVKLDKDPFIV